MLLLTGLCHVANTGDTSIHVPPTTVTTDNGAGVNVFTTVSTDKPQTDYITDDASHYVLQNELLSTITECGNDDVNTATECIIASNTVSNSIVYFTFKVSRYA